MQLFELPDYPVDDPEVSFAHQLVFGNSAGTPEGSEAIGSNCPFGYFCDIGKVTEVKSKYILLFSF